MAFFPLEEGEVVQWEARPSPRCYTFRRWRHSVFGCFFLLLSSMWQVWGISMAEQYPLILMTWLPFPFVLFGVYLTIGHLVYARFEWENVFFAITNRRLIAQRGLKKKRLCSVNLDQITYFSLRHHSADLGTFRIYQGTERRILLPCIEHPKLPKDLLEKSIQSNNSYNQELN